MAYSLCSKELPLSLAINVAENSDIKERPNTVIPGVSAENPIDWETLVALLPAYITAVVNGEEVEIPVTWECEAFPEAATGGK